METAYEFDYFSFSALKCFFPITSRHGCASISHPVFYDLSAEAHSTNFEREHRTKALLTQNASVYDEIESSKYTAQLVQAKFDLLVPNLLFLFAIQCTHNFATN